MNHFHPHLEMLEHRWAPTVVHTTLDLDNDAVTASDKDDIQIIGDANHTTITIVDDPAMGKVTLSIDATSNNSFLQTGQGDLAPTDFSYTNGSIVFNFSLGGGNDVINYSVVGGSWTGQSRALLLNLGSGADSFTLDLSAVAISDSHLAFDITGGGGPDLLTLKFGSVTDSFVSLKAALGGAGDQPTASFQGAVSNSTIQADIDVGTGFNTLNLDVADVDASEVALDVTGGNSSLHVDTIHANFNGAVTNAARLDVRVDLLAGNDVLTGSFKTGAFSVGSDARAMLLARGGAGNDTLTVTPSGNGTVAVDATGLLSLDLRGGIGNDKLAVGLPPSPPSNTPVPLVFSVDGNLQVRLDGNGGNDTLQVQVSNDNTSTDGDYDVAVFGGSGDDKFTYDLDDNGGTGITFAPSGFALLDGGAGSNMLSHKFADISTPFVARFLTEKKGGNPHGP